MLFAFSCVSVKSTQKKLNTGNYDAAIESSLKQLRSNKTKESSQPYVFLLQEAFFKARMRDLKTIRTLATEGNPESLRRQYEIIEAIERRQEKIFPILPLVDLKTGKEVEFDLQDHTQLRLEIRDKLSAYLYQIGESALKQEYPKDYYRRVYDDLAYINSINFAYRDIHNLMDQIFSRGVVHVYTALINNTDKIIPKDLQAEILSFPTDELNTFWTKFHQNTSKNYPSDYTLQLIFNEILISPEKIEEKIIPLEKEVSAGFVEVKDAEGNVVKNERGNPIKEEVFKTVKATFFENRQSKSITVFALVAIFDRETTKVVQKFPLESTWIFENLFAKFKGDREALDEGDLKMLKSEIIPFPSNEQMLYDASNEIKSDFLEVVKRISL